MTIALDTHLHPDSYRDSLARDVRAGLTSRSKSLPPKYFYDARGGDLFDQITRLPEYYPTRTERGILQARAADIARLTGAETLIELGSGTSEKTRILLDALTSSGTLERFVPFDVDTATLTQASATIAAEYPRLDVHAVVGDFERHLGLLPTQGRRLIAFLGSTIGNFDPAQRALLLGALRSTLRPGDAVLLGFDLVKDTTRLVAAYDDSLGVTAEFNRNVLTVLNRELDADFDPGSFDHVAVWNAEQEWIEMRLRSTRAQIARIGALDLDVRFEPGEDILTEISAKFRRDVVEQEMIAAGLEIHHWWTDPNNDFALSLALLP